MLSFSTRCRYFLYGGATDMRKSFDGLCGIIRRHTAHSPLSGDVFIFVNRRADRIKLLMWDVNGFALYYKRLEQGSIKMPAFVAGANTLEMVWSELVMLLEGIEIKSIKRRKRYQKSA